MVSLILLASPLPPLLEDPQRSPFSKFRSVG
jgi:hypothetical protein